MDHTNWREYQRKHNNGMLVIGFTQDNQLGSCLSALLRLTLHNGSESLDSDFHCHQKKECLKQEMAQSSQLPLTEDEECLSKKSDTNQTYFEWAKEQCG